MIAAADVRVATAVRHHLQLPPRVKDVVPEEQKIVLPASSVLEVAVAVTFVFPNLIPCPVVAIAVQTAPPGKLVKRGTEPAQAIKVAEVTPVVRIVLIAPAEPYASKELAREELPGMLFAKRTRAG